MEDEVIVSFQFIAVSILCPLILSPSFESHANLPAHYFRGSHRMLGHTLGEGEERGGALRLHASIKTCRLLIFVRE